MDTMDTSAVADGAGQDAADGTPTGSLADRVEAYENRAVEAFYLDPYLVGLLAARPCEAGEEHPPPGTAFA